MSHNKNKTWKVCPACGRGFGPDRNRTYCSTNCQYANVIQFPVHRVRD